MITIFYEHGNKDVGIWTDRLDSLFLKYSTVEEAGAEFPRLVDGKKIAQGKRAIDEYIDGLEYFVKGWYEDRCDKYEFDTDQ